ncbi:MAG: hypothetical protein OXU75_14040 [Deltaproteobacteria bacterium]|nr:hypothetical protein [Deltaproteobacteria bacterium]
MTWRVEVNATGLSGLDLALDISAPAARRTWSPRLERCRAPGRCGWLLHPSTGDLGDSARKAVGGGLDGIVGELGVAGGGLVVCTLLWPSSLSITCKPSSNSNPPLAEL